jgi:hypothetical protein
VTRAHAGQALNVAVSKTTLAIEVDDPETRMVHRTTTTPVRNIKADRPRTVPLSFLGSVSTITRHESVQPHLANGRG